LGATSGGSFGYKFSKEEDDYYSDLERK